MSVHLCFSRTYSLAACVLVSCTASVVLAQPPLVPFLMESQPTSAGSISGIRTVVITPDGGLAVQLRITGPNGMSHDAVWGRGGGSTANGLMLVADGQGSPHIITSMERSFGVDEAGVVTWSGMLESGGCNALGSIGSLDCVVRSNVVLGAEQMAVGPGFTAVWRDMGGVGSTGLGGAYWTGGQSSPGFGPVTTRGLYRFDAFASEVVGVVLPGDSVIGLPTSARTVAQVRSGRVGWNEDFAYSIVEIAGAMAQRGQLVKTTGLSPPSQSAVKIGGQLVREGDLIGGHHVLSGERWSRLSTPVLSQGSMGLWAMSARSDAPDDRDELVVVGGLPFGADGIAFREGSTLAGETILGPVEHLACNSSGDVAMIWRIDQNTRKALYLNSGLLAIQGGLVLIPGNAPGAPPISGRLTNFPGVQAVALRDKDANGMVKVCFVATVEVVDGSSINTGQDYRFDALFEVEIVPTPGVPICAADFNGTGGTTVQDIFDFLAAYFSTDPRADFNGVGGVTVQDIFDFLTAYFTGC